MKLCFCAIALTAVALGQVPHQHHPPSSEEYAKVLEDPSRDAWQKPHEVVMALDLKPTDTVADIGAGTGYFARRFALHASKVYAVDIDQKLLAIASSKAPANLQTILAAPDDPRLPPRSTDLIFFCDVVHHLGDRPVFYRKLANVLKPGGPYWSWSRPCRSLHAFFCGARVRDSRSRDPDTKECSDKSRRR